MTNTDSDSPRQPHQIHNSAAAVPVDAPVRKKRGRPRKFNSDGSLRVSSCSDVTSPPSGFSLVGCSSSPYMYYPDEGLRGGSGRGRGRGRECGRGHGRGRGGPDELQVLATMGDLFAITAGGDFTPHVVNVYVGEDIIGKMMSEFQRGPTGVCVLSANGAVSNVTIRQPGFSGGMLMYEGRFEILSMSGSFAIREVGGILTRSGGLSVSLAGPDGRVVGGGLVGTLIAASPIQMVVGSFTPNAYTHKRKYTRENLSSTTETADLVSVTEATPVQQANPSRGTAFTFSSSSLQQQNVEGFDRSRSNYRQVPGMRSTIGTGWNDPDHELIHGPSPDINVSVLDDQHEERLF